MIADAMQSALDAVRGRGKHIRFRIRAQRGKPQSAIAIYARRHRAGLIVISAGYGGRRGLARGVPWPGAWVDRAPCPVLVPPPPRGAGAAGFARLAPGRLRRRFHEGLGFRPEAAAAFAPHRGGADNPRTHASSDRCSLAASSPAGTERAVEAL